MCVLCPPPPLGSPPLGGIFCESAERGLLATALLLLLVLLLLLSQKEGEGTGWWKEGGQFAEDCVSTRRSESEAKQRQGETVQKKFKNSRGNQSDGQKLSSYFKALDLRGRKK